MSPVDEEPDADERLVRIEEYLSASRPGPSEVWSEDDTLILLSLQEARDAARRKGYSEDLLHTVLAALFSR